MNPEITDNLEIALRAYVELQGAPRRRRTEKKRVAPPSEWVLVFDTETTVDPGQSLRIGTYQVRKAEALQEAGIFYAPNSVTPKELELLRRYATEHGLTLRSRDEFVDEVFFGVGFDLRATIVGFNLPFDVARIALRHGSAHGDMRGGFSFTLSGDKRRPQLRVKHINQKCSLISFATPFKQRRARSERKRGDEVVRTRGHFVDVKTLAAALLSRSFNLSGLSEFLKVAHRKAKSEEHGQELTRTYLDYAVRDTQTTWECYADLLSRYKKLDLSDTPVTAIFSEASLGKAYLSAMGIKSWRIVQPDVPPEINGRIMGTYLGGRSEVRIRRQLRQVILCDFLSMYPTVCTLQGLWKFVIAQNMTWHDGTNEVRKFLEIVAIDDLLRRDTWPRLRAIVRVAPDGDALPVRAAYAPRDPATIGLNYLSADRGLWFTLADCVASKLLTGRPPKVLEAIVFEPGPPQPGLRPVAIAGNPENVVDPLSDDLYKRLIEQRQVVKGRRDAADGEDKAALDTEQNALKIAANATSYGIFAEVNVKPLAKKQPMRVYPPVGEPYTLDSDKLEEPGPFFHPLVASLIAGGARLMLAILERLVADAGLEWSFCDTDSMAIARPHSLAEPEFVERVNAVVRRFVALNPYEFGGSILKVEDVNFAIGTNERREPLYCWAVSAKRYVLFNLDVNRRPVIRKASAHGLGHLVAPYRDDDPAPNVPAPAVRLDKIGVERWQYDHWYQIIVAALEGHADTVNLTYHPALSQPAVSRYGATSPRLLKWFSLYNRNRLYQDQVKPFGFLHAFQGTSLPLENEDWQVFDAGNKRRRGGRSPNPLRPVATYSSNIDEAAEQAFDRETGKPVPAGRLLSYRDALAQYHLHPEMKFLNGYYLDSGTTIRRHVKVTTVRNIGKEADHWEEQFFLGLEGEMQIDHAISPEDTASRAEWLRERANEIGQRALARELGISRGKLTKFLL